MTAITTTTTTMTCMAFVDDYFSRARGSIVATASFIALSFTVTAILFSVAAFTTLAEAFQLTWMFVVATLMNLILAIAGCLRRRVSVSAFVWVYCITMALEAIAVSVEGVLELDDISMMPRDSGSGNRGETTVVLAAAVLIGMRPVRFWLPAAFFAAVLATNTLWNWFTVHRVYPEAAFVAFATVLFVAIAALRERTARQQYALRRRVAARLQQLQALLANILPFSFARRLARSGDAQAAIVTTLAEMRETVSARAIVDEFDCVTLMFLELCNFRDLVREARGDGRALVGELHRLYAALDDLCVRFGVEKIESVGNVFVAASGLRRGADERRECLRVLALAHAAHECVAALNAASPPDAFKFQIRIGVNCGRARAGVVGNHRTMFKIFGDTMNTASRMESNSVPQRTTASPAVFALVEREAELAWVERGAVEVKGKGAMVLRFVSIRNLAAVERELERDARVAADARSSAAAADAVLGDEQLPETRPWYVGNVFVNEALERQFVHSLVAQNRPFRWLILGVALTLVLGWGATFSSAVPPRHDAQTIAATIGAPFAIGALAFVAVSVLDARRATVARFVLGATFAALLGSQLFAMWLGIASQPPVRFAISSITTSAVFIALPAFDFRWTVLFYLCYAAAFMLVAFLRGGGGWAGAGLEVSVDVLNSFVFDVVGAIGSQSIHRELFALRRRLALEHERAARLLADLLPPHALDDVEAIAQTPRLALGAPGPAVSTYRDATVLFTDLVGFTTLSQRVPLAALVALLHRMYCHFDGIIREHGAFKMEVVGDAYVCALLEHPHNGAEVAVSIATQMQEFVRNLARQERVYEDDESAAAALRAVSMRVGVHTGTVFGAVVGRARFRYHLWGADMLIGNAMESNARPGAMLVSRECARRLPPHLRSGRFEAEPVGVTWDNREAPIEAFHSIGL